MREEHDTVIVGGGQAGLAMSYHLRHRSREHIVLERHRIAERWRTQRWDSLYFQLPNWALTLPGKSYSGPDPEGFSHHEHVTNFIVDYAREIEAPVRTGVEVTRLSQTDQGDYSVETSHGTLRARHVVIATGPFQHARVPDFASAIPASIYQLDAANYRNPAKIPEGAVLIVGSGNSGCQIAEELHRSGRRVFMSMGRHIRVPRRYLGKDLIWWYEHLGRFDVNIETFADRRYPPTTILTGVDGGYDLAPRHLGASGVTLLGRLTGQADGVLSFADDAAEILAAADLGYVSFIEAANNFASSPTAQSMFERAHPQPPPRPLNLMNIQRLDLRQQGVRSIIWASGHRFGFDWVDLPIIDKNGNPIQQRGVTSRRGIYFLGLHWMHTFRSAILTFVGRDAAYIADHIDGLGHDGAGVSAF